MGIGKSYEFLKCDSECKYIEIVGIKSRFPQTDPLFHSRTRNERLIKGDGGSQPFMQWSGGGGLTRLSLKCSNKYMKEKSEMKMY